MVGECTECGKLYSAIDTEGVCFACLAKPMIIAKMPDEVKKRRDLIASIRADIGEMMQTLHDFETKLNSLE